ncbi:hypothetical protein CLOSBL3_20525 [Clostridiaceae bacterium BL-3]|nr:hypothetical protein CLOSBL3_20525 [Clostridiaceae bacterium BL-3]
MLNPSTADALKAVKDADKIIAAWGNGSDFCNRASDVFFLLKSYKRI